MNVVPEAPVYDHSEFARDLTTEALRAWAEARANPVPLAPERAARIFRNAKVLAGRVPLADMTQAEADMAFEHAVRCE